MKKKILDSSLLYTLIAIVIGFIVGASPPGATGVDPG